MVASASSASSPEVLSDGPSVGEEPVPFALALSGGGYRAMLFHAGALWRMNEAGLLSKLTRVSSVSGGSITAALLGLAWRELGWREGKATQLKERVVDPLHGLAGRTIDVPSILLGTLFGTVGARIAAAYDRALFHGATLQHLPDAGSGPRFVINSTNVQTGSLFRFSRPYAADYQLGQIENPRISLALAVAASSAFPPFLSPVFIPVEPGSLKAFEDSQRRRESDVRRLVLTDGGVYDNLGLETVWKQGRTVFVSDGGARYKPEARPSRWWLGHTYRVLETIDNQVRALRKREIVGAFKSRAKEGAFWAIWGNADRYQLHASLERRAQGEIALAEVPTRLRKLPLRLQQRLVNWGYAMSDGSLRLNYDTALEPPVGYPYPDVGI